MSKIAWLIEEGQCLPVLGALRPLLPLCPFSRVILVPRALLGPLARTESG